METRLLVNIDPVHKRFIFWFWVLTGSGQEGESDGPHPGAGILDADIRSFFDSVDHEELLRIVSHRIADRRILRLIRSWLRAGVVEGNEWKETDRATPQGAGINPLLANIFLHYIFDLWIHRWRKRNGICQRQ
jgi:retron-type reverse transcriptase